MLSQCFDLLDPGIFFFDGRKQLISAGHSFVGQSLQFFIAVNIMLLQEEKSLSSLLQVEAFRPVLIGRSFTQSTVLDINQQINARLLCLAVRIPDICAGYFFFQRFLGIILTQGEETDKSLLCTAFNCNILSTLDLISLFRKQQQEFFPILWLSTDQIIKDRTDLGADRVPFGILRSFSPVSIWFSLDDGVTVLKTDDITESLQRDPGEEKVLELPAAVQCGGIKNDMVMDMCSVCMRG